MNTEDEMDPFTEELRLDMPSTSDEARVRAKLISAGVLAGASVVVPGAATAAAAPAATWFAKLVAVPLFAKVGAGVAVASLAAVPVVTHVTRSSAPAPQPLAAIATVAPAAAPLAPTTARSVVEAAPTLAVPAPRATDAPVAEPRAVVGARDVSVLPALEAPAPTRPSIGSFAALPEPVDEGTLRAETALMEHALAALQRGDVTTARRGFAAHAARYPNGHLAPERERALARMLGKETQP
jgi:hypothetical protein